jgi:chromosomal replication initiation ATPase DnaA
MFKTIKTAEQIAAEAAEAAREARIEELKAFLRDTDYVALSDYDKDKPEIIAERQAAREELRELGA